MASEDNIIISSAEEDKTVIVVQEAQSVTECHSILNQVIGYASQSESAAARAERAAAEVGPTIDAANEAKAARDEATAARDAAQGYASKIEEDFGDISELSGRIDDKADRDDIPTELKNPHALIFSGNVSATYDGSEGVTIPLDAGGVDPSAIAEVYDDDRIYQPGDYVIADNVLYRAKKQAWGNGPPDDEYWDATSVGENLTQMAADHASKALISDAWSSSKNYVVGDYCIYNNVLYKSKLDDNVNHNPTNTTYWTATSVGAELNNTVIIDHTATITDIDKSVMRNPTSYAASAELMNNYVLTSVTTVDGSTSDMRNKVFVKQSSISRSNNQINFTAIAPTVDAAISGTVTIRLVFNHK